jgi:hypothetical protein
MRTPGLHRIAKLRSGLVIKDELPEEVVLALERRLTQAGAVRRRRKR